MFNDWNFLAFSPLLPVATDILAPFEWLDHPGLVSGTLLFRMGVGWGVESSGYGLVGRCKQRWRKFFLPLITGAAQL